METTLNPLEITLKIYKKKFTILRNKLKRKTRRLNNYRMLRKRGIPKHNLRVEF